MKCRHVHDLLVKVLAVLQHTCIPPSKVASTSCVQVVNGEIDGFENHTATAVVDGDSNSLQPRGQNRVDTGMPLLKLSHVSRLAISTA